MKWTVIGQNLFTLHYQHLSQFMNDLGVVNQVDFQNCKSEDFATVLEESLLKYDQIRIDSPYRSLLLSIFNGKSMMVNSLGAADCLIQEKGVLTAKGTAKWWPQSILFHSFNQLYSKYGADLDLASGLMIVGSGASSRLAVAASVRAGFTKINISASFEDQGIAFVEDMKRRYLGLQFDFISPERLVQLPGSCSLLINTTPLVDDNELLAELYYLNFLRPDGMIWDLILSPANTPLIREGEHINIKCIRGREIAALADSFWLNSILPQKIDTQKLNDFYAHQFQDQPVEP